MTVYKMKLIALLLLISGQFQNFIVGYSTTEPLSNGETFDFIVVGSGPGGSTVAGRLAENGKYSVLLIEKGGFPIEDHEIPGLAYRYVFESNPSESIKFYRTVPQKNVAGGSNGIVQFPAGNTLGGGSAVNVMVANRGSPHDYNNWAKLTGDESWNYKNMLKYLKNLENYTGDYATEHRGYNGPISISRSYLYNPGLSEWLKAGLELGFPVADPNNQIKSFTAQDFSRLRGRRISAFKGYIEPMFQKSRGWDNFNLHHRHHNYHHLSINQFKKHFEEKKRKNNLLVLIHTKVNQIIFDEDNHHHAVGVHFTRNSSTSTSGLIDGFARARKEIILSGGAFETPVLLMKSGIGPRSVLEKAGIPVIKNLPVGNNLHDHPAVGITVVFGKKSAGFDPAAVVLNPASWRLFQETGDGPYSSFAGCNGQAYVITSKASPYEKQLGWPNVQLIAINGSPGYSNFGGVNVTDLQEHEIPVTWLAFGARPKSRGTVTLDDQNFEPVLDFKYLTHPGDIRLLFEGIKLLLKVCESTKAFKKIGCRVPTDPLPACSSIKLHSDKYWECYIKQMANHGFHAGGTCKMGSLKDPSAVVDTKLRVIGMKGLRVADASVMPQITNSNTQIPTYAIGEKAAEMILEHWSRRNNKEKFKSIRRDFQTNLLNVPAVTFGSDSEEFSNSNVGNHHDNYVPSFFL